MEDGKQRIALQFLSLRNKAGIDHVGIGSDFDGVNHKLPEGLEGKNYRFIVS
jgi:microsomal dipeptidase-like Zn-dependent dipeptidase